MLILGGVSPNSLWRRAPLNEGTSFLQEQRRRSCSNILLHLQQKVAQRAAVHDHNAILNGVTLEDLGPAPAVGPRITGVSFQGGVAVTFKSVTGLGTEPRSVKKQIPINFWSRTPLVPQTLACRITWRPKP